jgi:hypothetical protein
VSARTRFFIVLTLSLLILLVLSVFDANTRVAGALPIEQLLVPYWLQGWLPFFFEHLAIVVAVTGIITFSLALGPYDLGGKGRLVPAIRSILLTIVILGILNGIWFSVVGPMVERNLDRMEYRSRVAREARSEAERLHGLQAFDDAVALLRLYRSIVGASPELDDEIEKMAVDAGQARLRRRQAAAVGDLPAMPRAFEVRNLTVPDILRRAREALAEGSYYTAHYYAGVAAEQSPTVRVDALRLQSEALNAIEAGIRRTEENSTRSFFDAKLSAYQLLLRGDDDPQALIESYYRFDELSRQEPDDPDVQRYRAEAFERMQRIAFFADEALEAQRLPGFTDIIFFNRSAPDLRELIVVDRIVRATSGDFFFGVEVLRSGVEAGTATHFRAPYGKQIGDMLVLRAVEREGDPDDPSASITGPISFTEDGEVAGDAPPSGPLSPDIIPLSMDTAELIRIAGAAAAIDAVNLPELLRSPAALEAAGQSSNVALQELVRRVLRIGGFFILGFYGISVGWRYRSHYLGKPPVPILVMIPLLPWTVLWFTSIVRSTIDVIIRSEAIGDSPVTILGVAAAILLVGLVLVLVSLTRQTIEP